jgi:uncharacterized Zn-binding protein involved in type VI secretion
MPGVVRQGDNCSGHGCYGPRPPIEWSPNVYANGLPVTRFGDQWATHCCPPPCHGGQGEGIHNVYANGKMKQVIGDPISCGSTMVNGSGNVFVN